MASALIFTAGIGQAATIGYSDSGGRGASYDTRATADVSGIDLTETGSNTRTFEDTSASALKFNYFDASLGTLTRVDIDYTLTSLGNNSLSHLRRSCKTFTTAACSSHVVTASASVGYGITIDPYVTLLPGAPGYQDPTELGVGAAANISNPTTARGIFRPRTSASLSITDGQVANFIGTGLFDIQPIFVIRNTTDVSCRSPVTGTDLTGCSGDTRVTFNANYRVNVTYTYDEIVAPPPAVPLPAGLPLLLTGLLSLGYFSRRALKKT